MKSAEREILRASAREVAEQMAAEPGLAIPVDPDVADHMGAFKEDAVNLDDFDDLPS